MQHNIFAREHTVQPLRVQKQPKAHACCAYLCCQSSGREVRRGDGCPERVEPRGEPRLLSATASERIKAADGAASCARNVSTEGARPWYARILPCMCMPKDRMCTSRLWKRGVPALDDGTGAEEPQTSSLAHHVDCRHLKAEALGADWLSAIRPKLTTLDLPRLARSPAAQSRPD